MPVNTPSAMDISFWKRSLFLRLSVIGVSIFLVLLCCLFGFLVSFIVDADNHADQTMVQLTSQNLADKIERTFFERYGDIQAFAYNTLARKVLQNDSATADTQDFINTMMRYYGVYDLMMIVDMSGRVVVMNTLNQGGKAVAVEFVRQKNFSDQPWFTACISGQKGGWYSDFEKNAFVQSLQAQSGYGVAFAAPVRDGNGTCIGVWYNFTSWQRTVHLMQTNVEKELQHSDHEAYVLILRHDGQIIDATNPALLEQGMRMDSVSMYTETAAVFNPKQNYTDYTIGWAEAKGSSEYQGKNWYVLTSVNRSKITLGMLLTEKIRILILTILVVVGGVLGAAYYVLKKRVVHRITQTRDLLEEMVDGKLIAVPEAMKGPDELGRMASALEHFVHSITQKITFSNAIAQGKLSTQLHIQSEKDVLGTSLIYMQQQLLHNEEADKRRTWTVEGLAEIGELLRATTRLEALCESILLYLIRYLKLNQGTVFVVTGQGSEIRLEKKACYAFDRKKYLQGAVLPGEGLVGQVYLEKEYIYMTDIPESYISITSGLGDAPPRCVLLMPIMHDTQREGVLELASFHELQPFEIEFVRKATDAMASALLMANVNAQTRAMLDESQKQASLLEQKEAQLEELSQEIRLLQAALREKEYPSEPEQV